MFGKKFIGIDREITKVRNQIQGTSEFCRRSKNEDESKHGTGKTAH